MYQGTLVIGILAIQKIVKNKKQFIIPKAFVDWIKNQNVIVVYVKPTRSLKQIKCIYKNIDCLLITGGSDHPYPSNIVYNTAKYFLRQCLKKKCSIIGICMGLQYMLTHASKQHWNKLKYIVNALGEQKQIKFIGKQNTILANKRANNGKYYMHNHRHCITVKNYNKYIGNKYFKVLSTSKHDTEYVSTVIGNKGISFFGFQWHPEKPKYELSTKQNITRHPIAKQIGDTVAKNIVKQISKISTKKSSKNFVRNYNIDKLSLHSDKILKGYDDSILYYKVRN